MHCIHGVLRVQGALAVSRAIGDLHRKQWIISEPDIARLSLTADCQFLIIASDGLWDKVLCIHESHLTEILLYVSIVCWFQLYLINYNGDCMLYRLVSKRLWMWC